MQRDDARHDGRRGGAAAETLPPASTARDYTCAEALQQADDGRSSAPRWVQDARAVVQVSRNETLRGSWQAELAFGPQDRIIVDGHSAAHAVQQLVAVLPAALAARPQYGTGHTITYALGRGPATRDVGYAGCGHLLPHDRAKMDIV